MFSRIGWPHTHTLTLTHSQHMTCCNIATYSSHPFLASSPSDSDYSNYIINAWDFVIPMAPWPYGPMPYGLSSYTHTLTAYDLLQVIVHTPFFARFHSDYSTLFMPGILLAPWPHGLMATCLMALAHILTHTHNV